MMMRVCLSFLVASYCLISPAMSQETPLEFFPENVAVVVRWHAPGKSQDRLVEMVESIDVGWGVLVENALKNVGRVLENDTLAGVDDTKDWWVGFDIENNAIVYAIPGTDLETMSLSLNEEREFVAKGQWGVYSQDMAIIEQIKNSVDGGQTLAKLIPEELIKTPAEPGIEVIVSTATILEKYPQIEEEFNRNMDQQLEQANREDEAIINPSETEKARMAGRRLGQTVTQNAFKSFLHDSNFVKIQLSLNKDSIELRQRFTFLNDSPTHKILATPGRDCTDLIQRLPASDLYLATSVDGASWGFDMISQLMNQYEPSEQDAETRKKEIADFEKAKNDWKSSGFRGMAMGFTSAPDVRDGMLRVCAAIDAESMKGISSLIRDTTEAINQNERTELTIKTTEILGTSITQVESPTTRADEDDFDLAMKNLLLGDGTSIVSFGMNDTKGFATLGNSSKFTEAVIKTSLKGEADAASPKLAPAQSGQTIFLMAIDPVSFLQNFMTSADHGLRNGKQREPYPSASVNFTWTKQPLPKSYIVTEFSTSPASADLTITVPITTVKNVKAILPQLVPLVMRQGHLAN